MTKLLTTQTLRAFCRQPPPRAPPALEPFVSAGTLDETTIWLITEALELVAGTATGHKACVKQDEAEAAARLQCMKLPAVSVAETALKFIALHLRANNPRTQIVGCAEREVRRAALERFREDCNAHARVVAAAPRGGATGAVRALRDADTAADASRVDATDQKRETGNNTPSAFRAHATKFDRLRAMTRDELHERFMK